MDFISILSIFVMACFVGSITPALHTPLVAVLAMLRYDDPERRN